MKNVEEAETPPLAGGFETVMAPTPGLEMLPAATVAVNWVLDTKVVVRGLPLNSTTEAKPKFVPATVKVNPAPPAAAELGLNDVIVGAFGAGVGGGAGLGGGIRLNGGAGLTKFPATR